MNFGFNQVYLISSNILFIIESLMFIPIMSHYTNMAIDENKCQFLIDNTVVCIVLHACLLCLVIPIFLTIQCHMSRHYGYPCDRLVQFKHKCLVILSNVLYLAFLCVMAGYMFYAVKGGDHLTGKCLDLWKNLSFVKNMFVVFIAGFFGGMVGIWISLCNYWASSTSSSSSSSPSSSSSSSYSESSV